MVRTQIQLRADQADSLKQLAEERGTSMATLIREAVDELLKGGSKAARWKRALDAVGSVKSGQTDIGVNHDRYLVQAYRK